MAKPSDKFRHLLSTSNTDKILIGVLDALGSMDINLGDINIDMTSVENLLKGTGGTVRTPTFTIVSNAANVAAGAYKVSFFNTGAVAGTVLTTALEPDESITFEVRDADTLGEIAYVATGTTFAITTIS